MQITQRVFKAAIKSISLFVARRSLGNKRTEAACGKPHLIFSAAEVMQSTCSAKLSGRLVGQWVVCVWQRCDQLNCRVAQRLAKSLADSRLQRKTIKFHIHFSIFLRLANDEVNCER